MNGGEKWLNESSLTVGGGAGPGTFADERCLGAMSRGDAA